MTQHRVYLFCCWPREGFRTEKVLQRIEEYREVFIQRRLNNLKRLVLRAVSDEEFLHKNISKIDVYVDYGSTEDILENAYSLRMWRFDSVEVK